MLQICYKCILVTPKDHVCKPTASIIITSCICIPQEKFKNELKKRTFCIRWWKYQGSPLASGMAIRVVKFSNGEYKLERFLPKNQYTQRKLSNFENWISREVSKSAKSPNLLTFKVNFLSQKLTKFF